LGLFYQSVADVNVEIARAQPYFNQAASVIPTNYDAGGGGSTWGQLAPSQASPSTPASVGATPSQATISQTPASQQATPASPASNLGQLVGMWDLFVQSHQSAQGAATVSTFPGLPGFDLSSVAPDGANWATAVSLETQLAALQTAYNSAGQGTQVSVIVPASSSSPITTVLWVGGAVAGLYLFGPFIAGVFGFAGSAASSAGTYLPRKQTRRRNPRRSRKRKRNAGISYSSSASLTLPSRKRNPYAADYSYRVQSLEMRRSTPAIDQAWNIASKGNSREPTEEEYVDALKRVGTGRRR
jgi:hypothetical protein